MEVLLDLDTSVQTAICTQKTDVLVMELKHFERLLVKRNPRTIENLKEGLELRLKSRISKHLEKTVPILRVLLTKAEEYNALRQQQIEARMNANKEKEGKHSKTISETFDSFVPQQGALIDQYGPGTVFYRIRQREEAKALRAKKGRNFGGFQGGGGAKGEGADGGAGPSKQTHIRFANGTHKQGMDQQTSDPVLSNLENRMRKWLQNDPAASKQRGEPRVTKLQRTQLEVSDQIRYIV